MYHGRPNRKNLGIKQKNKRVPPVSQKTLRKLRRILRLPPDIRKKEQERCCFDGAQHKPQQDEVSNISNRTTRAKSVEDVGNNHCQKRERGRIVLWRRQHPSLEAVGQQTVAYQASSGRELFFSGWDGKNFRVVGKKNPVTNHHVNRFFILYNEQQYHRLTKNHAITAERKHNPQWNV